MQLTRTKIIVGIIAAVGILALTSAVVNWYSNTPKIPSTVYVTAPPIPSLGPVPKVDLKVPSVKIIPKEIVVTKLPKLPDSVKTNSDIEVLNTATTPSSEAGFNIVSTINKKDGSTEILISEKERSLFEFVNKRRVGVAYGVTTTGGAQTARVSGEWSFLRVGSAYVTAQAEIRSKQLQNTEGAAYIGVDYRW